jgi:hypothetical protein
MQLHFEYLDQSGNRFDGRGANFRHVIDRDSGEIVGFVRSGGTGRHKSGGFEVSLFGGKYTAWSLHRAEECQAFILGVQTFLNHMIPAKQTKPKPRLVLALP